MAIHRLLSDDALRHQISHNAATDAHQRFDARRMSEEYLRWYGEILGRPGLSSQMRETTREAAGATRNTGASV